MVWGSWFLKIIMSGTPLELESFPEKIERVEKALIYPEGDNAQFLESKDTKAKMRGVLMRISSVPRCEICDNALKRMKLFAKVLVFLLILMLVYFCSPNFPFFLVHL
jgi:hypothetical protein